MVRTPLETFACAMIDLQRTSIPSSRRSVAALHEMEAVETKAGSNVTLDSPRASSHGRARAGQTGPQAPPCRFGHLRQASLRADLIACCINIDYCTGNRRRLMQVRRMASLVVPQSTVLDTACERLIGWVGACVRWQCRATWASPEIVLKQTPRKPLNAPVLAVVRIHNSTMGVLTNRITSGMILICTHHIRFI
jgi:hypothetical protein